VSAAAQALRARVAAPLHAFRDVFRNRELARLELAWGFFYTADWAYFVALALFAYEQGGAFAVGLVGFLRMLPGALAAPFGSLLADRRRRELVLLGVYLSRALVLGASAAAVFMDASAAVVYALAGVGAVCSAPYRPSQWALTPSLARTPEELVAANAVASTLESLAGVAGPALGGILVALTDPGPVFATAAALFLVGAVLVAGIRTEAKPSEASGALLEEALVGFRTLAREPNPRLLIGLFGAQTLVRGALNVLIVVAALELLDMGESGVGFLNAAFGVGGLLGAFAALGLAGRRRLAHPFGLGLLLWGAPIALVGFWVEPTLALLWLAVVGAGNSVLDVAGFTLVQRIVDDRVLARVFGVLETMAMAAVGLGSLATPLLVDAVGGRTALVVIGSLLPALALLFWRRFGEIDAAAEVPTAELGVLRSVELFAPLPAPTLERLASRLVRLEFPAAAVIAAEGDPGDRFYILAEGQVEVRKGDRLLNTLGPGDFFGEIALLRDVPRTATVAAVTPVTVYALDREEFVGAVSGHPQSTRTADAVVGTRLASLGATR
jgi:predicted MFS family arabinose efflux permease